MMGKVCQLRTIASDLWCLSFRQKTLFTNQPEWRRLYLQSLATEKCWDWDIFRLTHEDKTERSVSFRQETRKKTFLQSYWTKKNTEIRIIVGWHMMIRESFWHKTLFTNQPNEDVSIYKYVFSWGEKHCPPPNYWVIGPQHRFHCKTTKDGNH